MIHYANFYKLEESAETCTDYHDTHVASGTTSVDSISDPTDHHGNYNSLQLSNLKCVFNQIFSLSPDTSNTGHVWAPNGKILLAPNSRWGIQYRKRMQNIRTQKFALRTKTPISRVPRIRIFQTHCYGHSESIIKHKKQKLARHLDQIIILRAKASGKDNENNA